MTYLLRYGGFKSVMKKIMSSAEIMKEIKNVAREKEELISYEERNKETSYTENETPLKSSYDYKAVSDELENLNAKERKLKLALSKANNETILDEFGIPLSLAIIYLAQESTNLARLKRLSEKDAISRTTLIRRSNSIEYTKLNYDLNDVKKDLETTRLLIQKLQIAIDLANLQNKVEVDI